MVTQNDVPLPILDRQGRALFPCRTCNGAMTQADFFDQGMRLPESYETAADYCDAELVDEFQHTACLSAKHSA